MNSKIVKMLAVMVAGAVILSGCNFDKDPGTPNNYKRANTGDFEAADTSVKMAENMAIGWNLGNAFDASSCDDWAYSAGLAMEYNWLPHKQATSQSLIKAVRAAGFKTIRIPVSWHNHMNKTTYAIDSAWMNRVKTVVDWALEEKMCVIINIHHDNLTEDEIASNPGFCLSTDEAVQAKSKAYVETVWSQIAETFKDYDNDVVFELLNEPRCVGTAMEWGFWDNAQGNNAGKESIYCPIITSYEQAALDVIRTSGGKNANRFVMAPGYAASPDYLYAYSLPADTATDRLILATHAYTPSNLCLEGSKTVFDSAAKSSIDTLFNNLKTKYVSKGIGVVMGEASASDKDNLAERIKWAEYYFAKSQAAGIPVVVWDNEQAIAMGATVGGENHGYFNRVTCVQIWPDMIKAMMTAVYGEESNGSNSGNSGSSGNDDPQPSAGEVVIFDASTFSGTPNVGEIVEVNGAKYLKVIPSKNWDTILNLSSGVSVTGKTKVTAIVKGESSETGHQALVQCLLENGNSVFGKNGSDNKSLGINPLTGTDKEVSLAMEETGTVTKIMFAVQETTNWNAVDGVTIYVKKIVAVSN